MSKYSSNFCPFFDCYTIFPKKESFRLTFLKPLKLIFKYLKTNIERPKMEYDEQLINYIDFRLFQKQKLWKLINATEKVTKNKVTIWKIRTSKVKRYFPLKEDQNKFYEIISSKLKSQIIHPNILKIYSVLNSKRIIFITERIEAVFSKDKRYSRDEILYLAMQLSNICEILHNQHHITILNLSPSSIFFSPSFHLKIGPLLGGFEFSDYTQPISFPFSESFQTLYFTLLNTPSYCAPEIIRKQLIYPSTDVFMYALIVIQFITGNQPLHAKDGKSYHVSEMVPIVSALRPEFQEFVKPCLTSNPLDRPSYSEISKKGIFSSKIAQIFSIFNNISEQNLPVLIDLLKQDLSFFSFSIQSQMILP